MRWLLDHPDLWAAFPNQTPLPDTSGIAEAMKTAGMFSSHTIVNESTIHRLVSLARFSRGLEKMQPYPQWN